MREGTRGPAPSLKGTPPSLFSDHISHDTWHRAQHLGTQVLAHCPSKHKSLSAQLCLSTAGMPQPPRTPSASLGRENEPLAVLTLKENAEGLGVLWHSCGRHFHTQRAVCPGDAHPWGCKPGSNPSTESNNAGLLDAHRPVSGKKKKKSSFHWTQKNSSSLNLYLSSFRFSLPLILSI